MARTRTIKAHACRHRFPQNGRLEYTDGTYILEYKLRSADVDFCVSCMWNFSTLCAWCHKRILLGDAVTLYTPTNPDFVHPWNEHYNPALYTRNPRRFMGCMGCADGPAHAAGVWQLDWKQRRLHVDRVLDRFDQRGTLEVSPVTSSLISELNTGRQLIAPIPVVGRPIPDSCLQRMVSDAKSQPVRVIAL
jgi:hypothetical protein